MIFSILFDVIGKIFHQKNTMLELRLLKNYFFSFSKKKKYIFIIKRWNEKVEGVKNIKPVMF